MMPRFSTSRRAAFTLVELLVVIGIISILVAVTSSAVLNGLAAAKKAKCASNLRSIGIGLLGFAGDNNGQFPEAGGTIYYNTKDPTTGSYGWTQQIEDYMGGPHSTVYLCPDSKNVIPNNLHYGYFLGGHAAYHETGGFAAVSMIKMRTASEHILAGDIAYSSFDPNDCDKDDYNQDPAFNGNAGNIPIHGGTVNILFADGHVENLKKFDTTCMTTIYDGPGHDYLY